MAKQPDKLKQVLRDRLGMAPSPEQQLQEAWTSLETGIGSIAESVQQLQQEAKTLGEQDALVVGIEGLASGLEQVVSAVETVETVLVDQGLVADDELLEPASPEADA